MAWKATRFDLKRRLVWLTDELGLGWKTFRFDSERNLYCFGELQGVVWRGAWFGLVGKPFKI